MPSRKITVSNMQYIAPIGTYGPVITPTFFDEKIVYSLVMKNYDVTEYSTNPETKGKTVKLNIHNFYDAKRFHDSTVKPVNTTNITGAPAAGRATAVNVVAPETPVTVPTQTEETPAEVTVEEKATPITPVNAGKLSNKQRKELARKAAAEKAAAAAEAAKAASTTEEVVPETIVETPAEDKVVTEGPVSLKEE